MSAASALPGPDYLELVGGIIAFPLATAILLLLFGKRFGRWAGLIATASIARSFVAAVTVFLDLTKVSPVAENVGSEAAHGNDRQILVHLFDWISVGELKVGADLLVDQLSIVMVLVVTGVGTLIHLYSVAYMRDDPRFPRYFAYLNLFAASMLLLVLAHNVLLLYVGWEGVGLCSYLLIGFWFEKRAAAGAAKKAFLVNRVGDFAFLLGIFVLASAVGSLTVGQINEAAGAMTAGTATIASLLLFAGATGKSAQIPLYVWLPDAMEGPTPVSALIHAATMVTAGVYLVARLSPVFEASGGSALAVVGWIGALTALAAAVMAAAEYDIKRVLAYSTISQLGYMFLAHGVGAYAAGIFHLVTHAFFKALMFLGAGAVMHALAGETDMRRMGGLRKVIPRTALLFAFGWLAISGLFPFAGFFSKDAILASAWNEGEYLLWGIGVVTAFLTAFYMSRLYFRVFEGGLSVPAGAHPHEPPWQMATALGILALLALVGGAINLPSLLTLEHFLEPVVGEAAVPEGIVPWILGGIALSAGLAGIGLARWAYLTRAGRLVRGRIRDAAPAAVGVAANKFYVDELYDRTVVRPGRGLAAFLADVFDRKVIDGLLTGSGVLLAKAAEGIRRVQSGYVRNYALSFLAGVVIVFSVLALRVVLP